MRKGFLGLLLWITCAAVFAADGRLGAQSNARITISLSILPTIQIETVSDIHLRIRDRTVDADYTEPFCVRGNRETKYSIIAYGSSDGGGRFALSNNKGEQLLYDVSYRGVLDTDRFDQLAPGLPSPVYNAISTESGCDSGTAFVINFRAEDLKAVQSGLYKGALTLLVSPV